MFSTTKLPALDSLNPVGVPYALVAGVGCYALWKYFEGWQHRRSLWRYIRELKERETKFRASLRAKLENDAAKWVAISQMPFDELVAKLQSGELKAAEALAAYQYAALVATEKTNAVAQFIESAEEMAEKLDESTGPKRPLHGVPFSVKEAYFVKGTETTGGLADYLGKSLKKENAPLVQFLIDQGCVPFIKTNIPQAMLTMDSRNAIYGMTLNPNDVTRSPGGSSSGEGAILAQRGSIIGLGSDIAGSLRIPVSWCGSCVTLKPTSYRVFKDRGGPDTEEWALIGGELEVYGFMTRDVSALVALHRLYYSAQTFAAFPKLTPLPFREEIFQNSKPLKIGYYMNLAGTVNAVPASRRAVLEAKAMLEARGHELVEFKPPNVDESWLLMISLLFADGDDDFTGALSRDVEIAYPNKHMLLSILPTWVRWLYALAFGRYHGPYQVRCMYAMTSCKSAHEMSVRYRNKMLYQEKFMAAFRAAGLDAIICPPTPCPAIPLDATREMNNGIYTALYNLLNWPAGVITVSSVTKTDEDSMGSYPAYGIVHRTIKEGFTPSATTTSAVGLPVAVQVAAPWFGEELVLRLMRELEESTTSSSKA